jgi:hypothetical protein
MTVRCEGDSWIMERLREKQEFEAELSRLGLRHKDFALQVRPGGLGGINRDWHANFAVRVSDVVTGSRGIYWGGPGEDWVAQFATDVAKGIYRGAPIGSRLPLPDIESLRSGGDNRT